MEIAIHAQISSLEKITILLHSASDIIDKSTSTKTNALRYIKWRQSAFRFSRNRQTKENIT